MKHYPVTQTALKNWAKAYQASPERRLATMALYRSAINQVDVKAPVANRLRHTFSVDIQTLEVTNQKHSGRCWLFAATNVVREKIARDLNLDAFELSQSYLAFWDKFERANYFLESILETADLPCDDRTVSFILQTGVHDGGQWDMFTNVVEKYGLVPKDVYDETYQSSNTGDMNHYLNRYLKVCAVRMRKLVAAGKDEKALRAEKEGMLEKIYGYLCSCYGEPPKKFDWEYTEKADKDGNRAYHRVKDLTPRSFCETYIGDFLKDTVSVIHAPTKDKPFDATYTIRFLGNVVGGHDVKHLNLDLAAFKAAIIRQLEAGEVVWFGSDVGKYGDRQEGFWDDAAFDAELVTGLDLAISKEDALDYGFSAMNHAMVITGVNLENGKPDRWRIENSWGDDRGNKGYYICSDTWFDQYVYQAAVQKKYLGEKAALYDRKPVELDPWDPMGTLAD
ncbi:MAG: C1 family peptidase [Clostridia bacterium]|nr:C1 family peptidase [Clostridia bacterium]